MTTSTDTFENLKAGDQHYKAYVGPPLKYDLVGAMQFKLLTSLGLRDSHKLLDIGCGSLRAGKLFIPYLRKGNYYGIEPNSWLVEEGIANELGKELIRIKKPLFNSSDSFEMSSFRTTFDFMIAQSIFSHTSVSQIKQCFAEASRALHFSGIFAATFVLGDENYEGDEWVYPGCVTFTEKYIRELAREFGFGAIKTDWYHPNGQTWFVIFHEGNRAGVEDVVRKLHTANKLTKEKMPIPQVKHWHYSWYGRIYRKIIWLSWAKWRA
ncbi:methyltransferase domain-containing protein [Phaeocystidibacter marisrubri]|uniref:Class I SAM-dependent methyltransferase n=1 Tax=Phaeocystidibacter marisrubri TaxID=1577780 RepID=A0A6L3ZHR4_9FLAO|nr:class I SAM-dependent methyltransferase [Phaeocystidibacter marisrubri]KAB2817532.1 class I SAM-dependent methyltransferase [Phaeocystidibacter marisrubri]GGH74869.1 hypothetical protein GCM10011318_21310 [Phaeocystidibacter marisrubri]